MRTIADTADNAVDHVKETATRAKGNLLDFGTQILKFVNTLRVMETRAADGLLDRVGLQRREGALRPVLWFAAGAVVAGSVALILTPVSGKQLRRRIAKMLDDGLDEAKHVEAAVEARIEDAVDGIKSGSNGTKTEHA